MSYPRQRRSSAFALHYQSSPQPLPPPADLLLSSGPQSGTQTSSMPLHLNFPAHWSLPLDKPPFYPALASASSLSASPSPSEPLFPPLPPHSVLPLSSTMSPITLPRIWPSYHPPPLTPPLPPPPPPAPPSYPNRRSDILVVPNRSTSSSKEKRHGFASLLMTFSSPFKRFSPDEFFSPSCQLCNKRFDRPSTLKKHLLVHTGEKAWACDICGRRFGVSSNLNRHARRCREKWLQEESARQAPEPVVANSTLRGSHPTLASIGPSSVMLTRTSISPGLSTSSSSPASRSSSSPPSSSTQTMQATPLTATFATSHKRKSPPDASGHPPAPIPSYSPTDQPPHQNSFSRSYKRQRRAPSPVRWIPNSLLAFDLTPISRSVPTPLPPVVPSIYEERNSYKNVGDNPYHRSCWEGHLVGPSYTGSNFANTRGQGKLMVF